jgi:hypothetical protein
MAIRVGIRPALSPSKTADKIPPRMADAPRQLKGFRVYCDESNTDGRKPHPVYGAILVSVDNLRRVQQELADWRSREDMHRELKWEKVRGGLRLKKYKSLVDLLFALSRQRRLMHFKAIILDRRAPGYHAYSKGDDELGFYKFYYHWLLKYFAQFPVRHRCQLRVIIDERPLPKDDPDPYTPLRIILNRGIRKQFHTTTDVVKNVEPLNSKQSDLLQAADVLMGAVGFHNQDFHLRPNADQDKVELARYIAALLGLRDLKHQTHPDKEAFKIVRWYWPGQPRQRYRRRAADNPRRFPDAK